MTQSRSQSAAFQAILTQLAEPQRVQALSPLASRFVHSLRMIALHERVGRDPVPELAVRLGSVEVAAKALAFAQTISSTWPENVQVSCFCCPVLTYDEASIGALIDAAAQCDRLAFEATIEGLIRPDRVHRLWDAVLGLVAAEARAV